MEMSDKELHGLVERIAWGIQYQVKKKNRQSYEHLPYLDEFCGGSDNVLKAVEEQLFVEQLLSTIPEQAQLIIRRTVLEGATDTEVANQLHVSQQAVNRCKRKYLHQLKNLLVSA